MNYLIRVVLDWIMLVLKISLVFFAGSSRGRLLIIVGDSVAWDLPKTCAILDEMPMEVELHTACWEGELVG